MRVVPVREHARVTIQLDSQPKSSVEPPDRNVPGHEHREERRRVEHERVARADVLSLVLDHQRTLILRQP
jgi:hypothetical protein